MSYTEIYGFDLEGNAHFEGEAHNAWRGGMAIWRIMELRHLPPLPPQYGMECHRYSTFPLGGKENPMKEIWDLADNPDIPVDQRIVLFTTFDNCLVKKEDLPSIYCKFMSITRASPVLMHIIDTNPQYTLSVTKRWLSTILELFRRFIICSCGGLLLDF